MTLTTPEIPPPPRLPTGTGAGRPSRFASVARYGAIVAGILAALGGGAGLRALWGQGEEDIRQNARIEAKLDGLIEGRKEDRAEVEQLKQDQVTNDTRHEAALAVLFAAQDRQGYAPPRGAPAATKQVRWVPTKNARAPVLPGEQDGRPLVLPEPALPSAIPE